MGFEGMIDLSDIPQRTLLPIGDAKMRIQSAVVKQNPEKGTVGVYVNLTCPAAPECDPVFFWLGLFMPEMDGQTRRNWSLQARSFCECFGLPQNFTKSIPGDIPEEGVKMENWIGAEGWVHLTQKVRNNELQNEVKNFTISA